MHLILSFMPCMVKIISQLKKKLSHNCINFLKILLPLENCTFLFNCIMLCMVQNHFFKIIFQFIFPVYPIIVMNNFCNEQVSEQEHSNITKQNTIKTISKIRSFQILIIIQIKIPNEPIEHKIKMINRNS